MRDGAMTRTAVVLPDPAIRQEASTNASFALAQAPHVLRGRRAVGDLEVAREVRRALVSDARRGVADPRALGDEELARGLEADVLQEAHRRAARHGAEAMCEVRRAAPAVTRHPRHAGRT